MIPSSMKSSTFPHEEVGLDLGLCQHAEKRSMTGPNQGSAGCRWPNLCRSLKINETHLDKEYYQM